MLVAAPVAGHIRQARLHRTGNGDAGDAPQAEGAQQAPGHIHHPHVQIQTGKQRDLLYELFTNIPGISCVKPKATLYMFPKVDVKKYNIKDDSKMILDLLRQEHLLMVQGTGFNWPKPDHFRITFLPNEEILTDAANRLSHFLKSYHQ